MNKITYYGLYSKVLGGLRVAKFRFDADDHVLDPAPSQALINHSPDGFSWGFAGSGPAQLALALLLDATGSKSKALTHYQEFKSKFVAAWPMGAGWFITRQEILAWLKTHKCYLSTGVLP